LIFAFVWYITVADKGAFVADHWYILYKKEALFEVCFATRFLRNCPLLFTHL